MHALSAETERRTPLIRWSLAVLVAVIAFSVYLPVRDGAFVFDDQKLVLGNEELWRPTESWTSELGHVVERMGGIFRAEEEGEVRTAYRPVRFASLRLDVLLTRAWGLDDGPGANPSPRVFHLHNALLHALNAWLVALLIALVRPRSPVWFPAAFALAFALHPVQTESVAYVSGRRDVLFLAFYLTTLIVYVLGRKNGRWGWGLAIAGLTWLALGAKEMAVTLPVTMLLLEGFCEPTPGDRPGLRRVVDRLALWLPAAIAAVVFAGFLLGRQNPGGGTGWWGGSPWTAFWSSGRAVLEYVRLLVWPHPLSVDYSFDAFPASRGPFSPWTGALAAVAIIGAVGFAVRKRRDHPELATAIILFLVLLAPVAQWIPHPERFAEHHLYLPSLAFLAAVAVAGRRLVTEAPEGSAAAFALVALTFGGLTVSRLEAWSGPYPLWRSAAEVHPRCARAHFGWGNAAKERGRPAEAVQALGVTVDLLAPVEREPLQQGYYLQALQMRAGILALSSVDADLELAESHLTTLLSETDTDGTPVDEDPVVWSELMKIRERRGDPEGATTAARRVLALDAPGPLHVPAQLYLAGASARDGDLEGAETILVEAMARSESGPQRALVHYHTGTLRMEQERFEEALEEFRRSEAEIGETRNRTSAIYKQAECLLHLGRIADARRVLEDLLEGTPGHLPALLSLGEILLGAGEIERAKEVYTAVLAAAPDDPRARQGLAQALAREKMTEPAAAPTADPTRVTALVMLADRLEAEEKFFDAIQALTKAEKMCEGPAERERRLSIRLRLARLLVRRGYISSRGGDDATATEQLTAAMDWYRQAREVALPEERGEAAIEAAEITRAMVGPGPAYDLLAGEYDLGVREPRLLGMLGAFAEMAERRDDAIRWYRAVLADEGTTDVGRANARSGLQRLGSDGTSEDPEER